MIVFSLISSVIANILDDGEFAYQGRLFVAYHCNNLFMLALVLLTKLMRGLEGVMSRSNHVKL